MNASSAPEIAVTLSPRLFTLLRAEADRLGVPLEWLVAAMILETIEEKMGNEPGA